MSNATDTQTAANSLESLPERLRQYAGILRANGFTVYLPGGTWQFFHYSREVGGETLYGYVQESRWGEIEHSMPIRPSRENGSSMWVQGVEEGDLSVDAAVQITQPTNWNPLVNTQRNHKPMTLSDRVALGPIE